MVLMKCSIKVTLFTKNWENDIYWI